MELAIYLNLTLTRTRTRTRAIALTHTHTLTQVELAIYFLALQPTMRLYQGYLAIALFPLSIAFVALVESFGID